MDRGECDDDDELVMRSMVSDDDVIIDLVMMTPHTRTGGRR